MPVRDVQFEMAYWSTTSYSIAHTTIMYSLNALVSEVIALCIPGLWFNIKY